MKKDYAKSDENENVMSFYDISSVNDAKFDKKPRRGIEMDNNTKEYLKKLSLLPVKSPVETPVQSPDKMHKILISIPVEYYYEYLENEFKRTRVSPSTNAAKFVMERILSELSRK